MCGTAALGQVLFPRNSGIPAADKPVQQFERQFVEIVSQQIAEHFYKHNPNAELRARRGGESMSGDAAVVRLASEASGKRLIADRGRCACSQRRRIASRRALRRRRLGPRRPVAVAALHRAAG